MSRDATPVPLGKIGIWAGQWALTAERAAQIERLGYGTIWIGGSPDADLAIVDTLLGATETISVATGIVNIWAADAATVADSFHRLEATYPGRFLLGVGVGHPEATAEYVRPYEALVKYLDVLADKKVPRERMVLAALGPKVLALAADRAAGAHPYLVTLEYARAARQLVGSGPLLAIEHKVALGSDHKQTLAVGRATVDRYLQMKNYRANLRRLGYSDAELNDGGTDALIDALVAQGPAEAVARTVSAYLDAGADHVCVHVLPDDSDPLPALGELAPALKLT